MITLTVVSELGNPQAIPLSRRFDRSGGTIGRSSDCTLALHDPGRHISRVQGRVDWIDGRIVLTCLGSSHAMSVNGTALETGASVTLQDGDTVQVAQYALRVDLDARPAAPTPLSALDSPQGWASPGHPSAGARDAPSLPSDWGAPVDDPLAAFDLSGKRPSREPREQAGLRTGLSEDESLDRLFGLQSLPSDPLGLGSPLAAPLSAPNTASAPDPMLALLSEPKPPPAPVRDDASELRAHMRLPEAIPPTDFGFALDEEAPRSKVAAAATPAPAGPPSASPQAVAAPMAASATAAAPLPARASIEKPPSAEMRVEEPFAAHVPTAEPFAAPAPTGTTTPSPPMPPAAESLAPPVLSWIDQPAGTDPAPLAGLHADRPAAAGSAPPGNSTAAGAAPGTSAAVRIAPPVAEPPPAAPQDRDALLAALLAGLGLEQLPGNRGGASPGLTPELMQRLGELLRVSIESTVNLLQTRSTIKREMRAEVTTIVAGGNNPLKFSPDGESALLQLLAPKPMRGFMPGVEAVRDASDDMLAHQLAMVAGMRGALHTLLTRFDPEQLETRLTRRSVIDSVLPGARRARLWELYEALYREISREAEDDFEALFGQEFVRAYEAQVASLKAPPGGHAGYARDESEAGPGRPLAGREE